MCVNLPGHPSLTNTVIMKSIRSLNWQTPATLLLAVFFVAACGSTPSRPSDPGFDQRAETLPVTLDGDAAGIPVDPNSVAGRAPRERVIYFDFNAAEIRPEYLAVITDHGRFLAQNPDGRIRLEGHTDERGTREYNVALGENRARSISTMLQLQGVNRNQISLISFGEELPVDEAHSEGAWAQNRRVNMIYAVE